jgi:hypothetical protein
MRQPLKILRPSGGHILDIDAAEIAEQFLTTAHNVTTRKGFPSRRGGRRIAYPVVSNDAYHVLNLQLNTFNWWMRFGTNNIHATEGSNDYDITFAGMQTIDDPSEWSATLLNGIPVFTNGKDVALYWDGSGGTDALAIPGFPAATSCKYIVAFRFHLFALNIDGALPGATPGVYDNAIMWSDATDPGAIPSSWTPGAGNEAGYTFLADTRGRCVCGVPLNSQLMIYKPEAVYPVEYAGQQPDNIFVVRPANRSLGALGPHTVIDLGDQHLVVGNDDVCLFDGVRVRSIAENRVKNFLANSIDETYAANSFVVRDLNKRETWVCVPESGSRFATVAHVWDERRDTWVTRDLNNVRHGTVGFVTDTTPSEVWDADAQPWDSDISAWNEGSTGAITRVVLSEEDILYVEDTTDTISVTALIAKNDLAFEDDSQNKLINAVWIRGTGLGFANVEFRLGSRQSTEAAITWQAWQPCRDDGQLTVPEISGRYISIEIRATSDNDWTINRIIFDWKYNGAY